MDCTFYYYIGGNLVDWHITLNLTKTQSAPVYRWTWSGMANQQAWVELDLTAQRMRCYFYLKRYGDNVYIEGLSPWKPFNYYDQFGATFTEWETLVNCQSATVVVTIGCEL